MPLWERPAVSPYVCLPNSKQTHISPVNVHPRSYPTIRNRSAELMLCRLHNAGVPSAL